MKIEIDGSANKPQYKRLCELKQNEIGVIEHLGLGGLGGSFYYYLGNGDGTFIRLSDFFCSVRKDDLSKVRILPPGESITLKVTA